MGGRKLVYKVVYLWFTIYMKKHLVRNCANGTQKLQLENLVRSMGSPFTVRPEAVKTNYNVSTTTQKKCKWNEINRLKRSNQSKRTTFSSKPFIPVIFRLGRPKMCVPFIFHSEILECLCKW